MIRLGTLELEDAKLAALCRRYQVRQLSVFGSAARGDMRPDSDIDLLVEFLPETEIGLLEHAGLMLDLSELLGRRVDLVSKRGLKPLIRDSILREAPPGLCGRACARITAGLKARHPEIPWPKIAAFRNILVQEYFGIDWSEVWLAASKQVPQLRIEEPLNRAPR